MQLKCTPPKYPSFVSRLENCSSLFHIVQFLDIVEIKLANIRREQEKL